MPDWDVSLVTDMSGWTGSAFQGFGESTFNGDIGSWNTAQVTNMSICLIPLLRSTKTLGVGTQRKWLIWIVCFVPLLRSTKTLGIGTQRKWLIWVYVLSRFCVQPRHWELEHSASDWYEIYVFPASAFNQDIGSWNTAQVTDMAYVLFRFCVQPRHWELEHSASDWYGSYVSFRFCVQPRHWELEHSASD